MRHGLQRGMTWVVLAALIWAAPVAAAPPAGPAARNGAAVTLDATVGLGTANTCTTQTLSVALALVQANGGGQIGFDCGAAPVTIVVSPTLLITSSVGFDGGTLGDITLSGNNLWRVFTVLTGASLTLTDLVIADGVVGDGYGGCIWAIASTLMLERVTVHTCRTGPPLAAQDGPPPGIVEGTTSTGGAVANSGGTAILTDSQVLSSTADDGGGLYNSGMLTLNNTRVAGNHAQSSGGGMSVAGTTVLINSLIEHNRSSYGGGISTYLTTNLSVQNSRLYSNTATVNGGGIYSNYSLALGQSRIEANTAGNDGGGLYVFTGTTNITQTVFSANAADVGGGLFLLGGTVNLGQVVVDANTASDGGGVANDGARTFLVATTLSHNQASSDGGGFYDTGANGWSILTNVTVSGNSAGSVAGGIKSVKPLTMTNVTVANNAAISSGGGFYRTNNIYPYEWANVLLANNTASGGTYNCAGALPNFSVNSLSSDPTCIIGSGLNAALPLGPLQINGGGGFQTPTHLLLPGSEAIDGGYNPYCAGTDQRGVVRPINGTCDVGAVEIGAVLPWLWLPLMRR